MEIPGDGESFRHELNDPGSEDWAVICLDGLWQTNLRRWVLGVPEPPWLPRRWGEPPGKLN